METIRDDDARDASKWTSFADPDPEYLETIQAMGGAPNLAAFDNIADLRKFLARSKAAMSDGYGGIPGVKEEDHQIPMRDGHRITVRVYSPETKPSGGSPLGVVLHGGGWCLGGLVGEELLCRLMASKLGMVAVNVDYRLAPEYKFPTGPQDCYDATKWAGSAAENASALGADPSKGFTVGGSSAGGNMGVVVSHLARDEGLKPALTGCHLMIPAVCSDECFPEKHKKDWKSWDQLPDAAILNHKATDLFRDNYIPNKADRANHLFSPLFWPSGHKGLPPNYFQIAGGDPLRDEALIYERILREDDGVKTKVDLYPGQPHGFWSVFPHMKASKTFMDDSINGIKWLLEQQ
ncbi:related to sterigmatocystin biosynthesis lipase esterase STCI [Lecanosticta acicola]|uniref:Related to sterigmatocystin biosynthesis lipase esterase STCI n=1 Tax=Lecanosticta acicola TaxID=111012 RepID=A0AAI8YWG7_9PEZI|nr:related to sterigmatocystin biosynthesis lipase esterase STCI [Lecanosticta acicola]